MKKQPHITMQTKANLKESFWKLYIQKPIEKISVKEKLNEMREKINGQKVPGKEEPLKGKAKEKSKSPTT